MTVFFLLLLLSSSPLRLVSLAPSLTEIVYYLNIDSLLVGNTIYCNYPEDAKKKTHVGDLINPNIERIKKLKPDYILLVSPMQDRLAYKLNKAGLNVLKCRQDNFIDIANCMKKIGKLVQDTSGYVRFMKEIKNIDTLSAFRRKPKVVFVLSQRPMYAPGKNTFIDEIIHKAGGENAFSFNGYKMVSVEKIHLANPDIIILVGEKSNPQRFSKKLGIRETDASQKHCIFKVDTDVFTRPGPRVINAVLELRKIMENCIKDGKNQ